jgi:hypothetical protein
MCTANTEERGPILVELAPRPGVVQVSLARLSAEELAALSAKALDSAMTTVQHMSERVSATIDGLAGNPDEVEVEFGLKLDVEGQALIAKAGAEAAINVTLTWKREEAGGE